MPIKKLRSCRWCLLVIIGLLLVFMSPITMQANVKYHVDYTILDARTQQVSPFDKLFVKPAQVTIQKNEYYILINTKDLLNLDVSDFKGIMINGQQVTLTKLRPNAKLTPYQITFKPINLTELLHISVSQGPQVKPIAVNIKWGANNIPNFNTRQQGKQYQRVTKQLIGKPTPRDNEQLTNKQHNLQQLTTSQVSQVTTKNTNSQEIPQHEKNNSTVNYHHQAKVVKKFNQRNEQSKVKSKAQPNMVFLTSIGILFAVVAAGYWRSLNHK